MARPGYGSRVEGVHPVAAALAAGRVRSVTAARQRAGTPDIARLLENARAAGASVDVVDDVGPLAATDAHQGVVARAAPIPYVDLSVAVAATEPAAVVVLDHIEDPRNVGAIARSAVAGGFGALVVPTRRAAPLEATAFKASAGALEHLRVAGVSSVADAIARLRDLGVWSVGLAGGAEQSIFGLDLLTAPVAIVVGAEGSGIGRLVADRVDVTASIPLLGPVESLNASVAAALAIYETARLRGLPA